MRDALSCIPRVVAWRLRTWTERYPARHRISCCCYLSWKRISRVQFIFVGVKLCNQYSYMFRHFHDVFREFTTIALLRYRVKQSHYRSGQAMMVPGGWGSRISRQSAHEGGKDVSPRHRPPLPQEIFLTLISVRGWVTPGP